MNPPDYAEIAERPLEIATPTSPEKLLRLADLCRVGPESRALDVGSGQGFLLRLWAARRGLRRGTGLERSAAAAAAAATKARAEGVDGALRFVVATAAAAPTDPEGYDVITCLGASFALGGFGSALAWMEQRLRPGGAVAVGEPYLTRPVPPEILREEQAADLRPWRALLPGVRASGLRLTGVFVASAREWERYCTGTWENVADWARRHPDHPARADLEREAAVWRERYQRFARDAVGWAIFVAERSGDQPGAPGGGSA